MFPLTTKRRNKGKISVNQTASSSSSSSIIGSNVDLLTQILLHLPLKSLITSKSVSKQWCSLISNPIFLHKHFLQNRRLSVSGLYWIENYFGRDGQESVYDYIKLDNGDANGNCYVPFETLSFANIDFSIKIVQSCNGLFLCSSCSFDNDKCIYYILNPFTKQYSILPRSKLRKSGFSFSNNVSLVYDPLRSPYYKVICMWNNGASLVKRRIEIYSSETSSWRRCGDEYMVASTLGTTMPGVFWNGSLHWIDANASLVYFDIDREVIGEVSRPYQDIPRYFSDHTINSFGEFGGHLFCIEVSNVEASRFKVLEMDTGYTGWNVKYRVDLEGLRELYPRLSFDCGYNLISFEEEKEDSPKLILLIHESEVVISYDLVNMSSVKIGKVAPGHNTQKGIPFQEEYSFHKYIESLAYV
ncbi:hypothetical protein MKX01_010526 [Papaver californicum]|nr:hypothetical protein MKX01_010526 [Papaver californicum]